LTHPSYSGQEPWQLEHIELPLWACTLSTDAAEAMQVLTTKMDLQDVYEPWSSVLGLPQNCDPADEAQIQIHVAKLYFISNLHGPLFVGSSKC
jgi:hypothetical protein